MKNDKRKNRSSISGKHLDINGKVKKTTSKHLKKISKSNQAIKNGLFCSVCNQFLAISHFTAGQKFADKYLHCCNKCVSKIEKKSRNKEIVQHIYQRMGISSLPITKTNETLAHEMRERRKNKGDFRKSILIRDQHRCFYCDEFGDTVDHLIPIARGGFTTIENCICSCAFCNHLKSDLEVQAFLKGLSLFSNDEWIALKKQWSASP